MPAQGAVRDRDSGLRLIETFRREADGGFVRLDLHLERLAASARTLGFVHDAHAIDAALAALDPATGPQRIRLVLTAEGTPSVTAEPFAPTASGTVWRLALAAQRLDPDDALLRHKTSRRTAYDRARAEVAPADAEEVLLCNTRGEVCEGTITTLFAELGEGPLATPALSCGLLAGVLRAELLARGEAREAVLTPEALAGARRLFVGNSLRGLIEARLCR